MLKSLFNSSIILAATGFILICSSSPESSTIAFTKFINQVSSLTSKHRTSLMPNYYTDAHCSACQSFPYKMSLVGMYDYYNTMPTYGSFIR